MEELSDFLKARTGWNIGTTELVRLHAKYFDEARQAIDYNRLMDDIRDGVDIKERSNYLDAEAISKQKRYLKFDQIIDLLHSKILTRIETLRGENQLKKAYLLLGESRSPVVTRQQLKIACQSRLSVFLNDNEIEEVFKQLDKDREGTINIRQLISLVLKRESETANMSIVMNSSDKKHRTRSVANDDNQNASITYDKKFKDLVPPDPARCRMFTMQEVEDFIFDRIFERSNLNDNLLKTTTKLFGDGEITSGYHTITLDMMRYTLWKRLKMNISDEDVQKFFKKHAKGPNGTILLFDFIEAIISRRQTNTPLLDDRTHVDKGDRHKLSATMQENHNIEYFLIYVRKKLNDMINRESRAPHYLLHGNTRMTENQAKDFLRGRLGVDLDDTNVFPPYLKAMVLQEYRSNSLIDTKRILLEAMAIKEERVRGADELVGTLPNQTLLNGATVSVDRMPAALARARMTPDKIEEMIYQKCTERLKNDHPHASLHKMFREQDGDPRVITRKGMRTVFHKFDIVMSPEEFDEFYAKYDRGDGKIDIHYFLKSLMPPVDVDISPFVPKDPAKVKTETALSQVMEELTGRRHEVSWLNGPTSARTQPEFLQSLKPSSASMTMLPRRPSTSGGQGVGNNNSNTTSNSNNNNGSTASLATVQSNSSSPRLGSAPRHKSLSILQAASASQQPNWNPNSAVDPLHDDNRSVSTASTAATPTVPVSTAGLTEQIHFAEALLKALKDLPAYKQQQAMLLQQQQQQLLDDHDNKSSAPLSRVPSAPPSPAPSRSAQAPRRPSSSASAPSSTASSPNKVVTIAATGDAPSGGGRRLIEKSTVALDTVPEDAEAPTATSNPTADHLRNSEQLLALAEAYARATGVLTQAAAASDDASVHSTSSTSKKSIHAKATKSGKPSADALKINLGKLSEPFVAPDPSTANLTHLLEQSSLLHVSPRSNNNNNNNGNKTSNNNRVNNKKTNLKPHRPVTAPAYPGQTVPNHHAKSTSTFHFKHLKVNQPVIDPYSPPSITGTTAFTGTSNSVPATARSHQSDISAQTAPVTSSRHPTSARSRTSLGSKASTKSFKRTAATDSGFKQPLPVNPYTEGLLDNYRLRKKILVTSNQEYGLFVKNLHQAMKQRAQLVKRQAKEAAETIRGDGDEEEEEGDDSNDERSKASSTPRKAATLSMIRVGTIARTMSKTPSAASTTVPRPATAM